MGDSKGLTLHSIVKALENSPKGRLRYDTGWDEGPNAITALITNVQETEIDGPNRNAIERCYRVHHLKERISLSPKTSPNERYSSKSRRSLPVTVSRPGQESSQISPALISSLTGLSIEGSKKSVNSPGREFSSDSKSSVARLEPRIEIQEESSSWLVMEPRVHNSQQFYNLGSARRRLLTPPTPTSHRRKSVNGSPNLKPSPTLSSSTQTRTRSSTTTDTSITPTRNLTAGKQKKGFGINDESIDEGKLEEDLLLESKVCPYTFIENCLAKYEEEKDRKVKEATQRKLQEFADEERKREQKAKLEQEAVTKAIRDRDEATIRCWKELEENNLKEIQRQQTSRFKKEQELHQERIAAAAAAEQERANRKATQEAAKQKERQRIAQANEEQKRKEEAAVLEKERLQQKVAEEKQLAKESAARERLEARRDAQVVPELSGLILKDDLTKYARTTGILKKYEEPVAHIDGKDAQTKPFYVGAVKCINTPLNALADTHENDIMLKVQHFSKLLSGEPVSGGGSMAGSFTCTAVPNGDLFVMKTFAFRFVKKSEADVTRGKSTVQPLATVGVHLCKLFPAWAALVQANMYKLCPFLVPFSYPQADKSVQEYAKELGHDLSGSEAAIQQTFLERLKGYCTLYALMVLKFDNDGPFDIGEATEFFTIGGAWQILARTLKLEPQVDVTATVLHTILDILDDRLYAVYKTQFGKLMRLLILTYIPKIRAITPPAKAGSLSRLQIYLEKKFTV